MDKTARIFVRDDYCAQGIVERLHRTLLDDQPPRRPLHRPKFRHT
jgi:hypothetical protein